METDRIRNMVCWKRPSNIFARSAQHKKNVAHKKSHRMEDSNESMFLAQNPVKGKREMATDRLGVAQIENKLSDTCTTPASGNNKAQFKSSCALQSTKQGYALMMEAMREQQ